MNFKTIAFRYAKALFESDLQNNLHEKRLQEFESMSAQLKEHPNLNQILLAPHFDIKEKFKIISLLLNHEPDSLFRKFIELLLTKKRFRYFTQIAFDYRLIFDRSLNVWEADFITAIPLDKDSEDKIRMRLEKHYNKKIKIKNKIDPRVIGAAVIILDNKMIDWSVAGRLKALKEKLLESGT